MLQLSQRPITGASTQEGSSKLSTSLLRSDPLEDPARGCSAYAESPVETPGRETRQGPLPGLRGEERRSEPKAVRSEDKQTQQVPTGVQAAGGANQNRKRREAAYTRFGLRDNGCSPSKTEPSSKQLGTKSRAQESVRLEPSLDTSGRCRE